MEQRVIEAVPVVAPEGGPVWVVAPEEVEGALVPLERALERGRVAPTVELLAAFRDFLRLDVADGAPSKETIRSYWSSVNQFVSWCREGGIEPGGAVEDDVRDYRAWLIEQEYTRSTIGNKLVAVRRFYEMAVARGFRGDNPAKGLRAPKDRTDRAERVKWLPLAAVQRLLNAPDLKLIKGVRDRAILGLMALHGLRTIEIQRLNLEDVDLEAGEAGALAVFGKGDKRRSVLLVAQTAEMVKAWLRVRDQVVRTGEVALFPSCWRVNPGGRMSRRGIRTMVDGYLTALGLKREGVSCHALRHSCGTLSRAAGAELDAIADQFGHASVVTTQIYSKIVDKHKNNPAKFLVGALEGLE
jgi:site-specific recombinase XerD